MIDITDCNKCNCALLKLESNQNPAPKTPHLLPKKYPTLVPKPAMSYSLIKQIIPDSSARMRESSGVKAQSHWIPVSAGDSAMRVLI